MVVLIIQLYFHYFSKIVHVFSKFVVTFHSPSRMVGHHEPSWHICPPPGWPIIAIMEQQQWELLIQIFMFELMEQNYIDPGEGGGASEQIS